jgi:hypothetical protein
VKDDIFKGGTYSKEDLLNIMETSVFYSTPESIEKEIGRLDILFNKAIDRSLGKMEFEFATYIRKLNTKLMKLQNQIMKKFNIKYERDYDEEDNGDSVRVIRLNVRRQEKLDLILKLIKKQEIRFTSLNKKASFLITRDFGITESFFIPKLENFIEYVDSDKKNHLDLNYSNELITFSVVYEKLITIYYRKQVEDSVRKYFEVLKRLEEERLAFEQFYKIVDRFKISEMKKRKKTTTNELILMFEKHLS